MAIQRRTTNTVAWPLLIILVLTACLKNHLTNPSNNTTSASLPLSDTVLIKDTTIFFDVVLEGQRQLQIQPLNKYFVYWTGIVPYITGTYGLYEQGITNEGGFGMVLIRGNIKLDAGDTSVLLKNRRMFDGFQPGSFSYTQNPDNVSGVKIHWIDSAGTTWGTDFGVADQSNSQFQIISRMNLDTAYNSTGVTHSVYVRCAFNCMLYNNSGKSMEIKNGRMGISVWL